MKNRRIGRRWARRRFRMEKLASLPERSGIGRLSAMLGVALATVQHWLEIGLRSTRRGNRREVRNRDLIRFLRASGRVEKGRSRKK